MTAIFEIIEFSAITQQFMNTISGAALFSFLSLLTFFIFFPFQRIETQWQCYALYKNCCYYYYYLENN